MRIKWFRKNGFVMMTSYPMQNKRVPETWAAKGAKTRARARAREKKKKEEKKKRRQRSEGE
jgi:hypothetical protein